MKGKRFVFMDFIILKFYQREVRIVEVKWILSIVVKPGFTASMCEPLKWNENLKTLFYLSYSDL